MNVCLGRVHAASYNTNRIGGVMVSVLASSAVDRAIPKSKQSDICCFSGKHAALRKRAKTGWLGIMIICPSERHFYPRTVVSVS